jgi:serine/threonine protein kinase
MSAPSTAQFAGYRVEAVAGRGGMGVVYRATQLGLDRPVALKVIASGLLGDPRVRERFLSESRAAAAIEHPNVIPIHAYGEHDGHAYSATRACTAPEEDPGDEGSAEAHEA